MKDASVYLKHIQDAIARIESYTGQGRKAFFDNTMVQDAVIRNLEVIGEAVKQLPADLRQRHPRIPWRFRRLKPKRYSTLSKMGCIVFPSSSNSRIA